MNFQEYYYEDKGLFEQYFREVIDDTADVEEINPEFVSRLCSYLEKGIPTHATLNSSLGQELRKYIKGDNDQIKKIKKKIIDAINKAKVKFLDAIENKCEKIQVVPKPSSGDISSNEPVEF